MESKETPYLYAISFAVVDANGEPDGSSTMPYNAVANSFTEAVNALRAAQNFKKSDIRFGDVVNSEREFAG